jgi:hypothetical protein
VEAYFLVSSFVEKSVIAQFVKNQFGATGNFFRFKKSQAAGGTLAIPHRFAGFAIGSLMYVNDNDSRKPRIS